MANSLANLLVDARRPRILVVGDVMLDRYLWGDVSRISPEAPIPILQVEREEHRLGGAGSVAAMLAALEADVLLATVTGDDYEGRLIRGLLEQIHVGTPHVAIDAHRPTTVKERLLGRTHSHYPQQMIRVDRELTQPIGAELASQLLETVWDHLDEVDLILVSDYNKGVCAGEFLSQLVAIARAANVPVVADPVRGADYRRYAGCTAITPNRTEAGLAAQMQIRTPQDGLAAAQRLLRYGVESVLVTLDRDGIAWADSQDRSRQFPVRPRQVHDITGAGDMVLSALGYCLALGADYPEAIELANLAGGLEVERLGVVPITRGELLAEVERRSFSTRSKVVALGDLQSQLQLHRQRGQRIVMTNGCFDLLHPGHVASLEEARSHGDVLVVGLNSDRSVQELKGPDRPVIDQHGRAAMLAALACVDYVVVFDEPSVSGLVEQVRPDVLVKSAEYAVDQVVGQDFVQQYGGQVVLTAVQPGYSTTRLMERIVESRA